MATSGRDEKASRARLMQLMGGLQKEDGPPPRSTPGGGGGGGSGGGGSGGGGGGAGRPSRKVPRSTSSSGSGGNASSSSSGGGGADSEKKGRSRKRPLKSSSSSSSSKTSPSKTATAINHSSNWSPANSNDSSSIAQIALWGRLKIGGFVSGEEDKAVLSPVLARLVSLPPAPAPRHRPCTPWTETLSSPPLTPPHHSSVNEFM